MECIYRERERDFDSCNLVRYIYAIYDVHILFDLIGGSMVNSNELTEVGIV